VAVTFCYYYWFFFFLFKTHYIRLFQEAFKPSVSCIKQNASLLDAHVYSMVSILLDLKFRLGQDCILDEQFLVYAISLS